MRISEADLKAEVVGAQTQWPWIEVFNIKYGLPIGFMMAIGSRETNLRNVVGDGGHGHGVFQLDDRSHTIPPEFDGNVYSQADVAGFMLSDTYRRGDLSIISTANIYNSGQADTRYTTGGDYGTDVYDRMMYIQYLYSRGDILMDPVWGARVFNPRRADHPQESVDLSALETLAWAAAHGANARDDIAKLRADLPQIIRDAVRGS